MNKTTTQLFLFSFFTCFLLFFIIGCENDVDSASPIIIENGGIDPENDDNGKVLQNRDKTTNDFQKNQTGSLSNYTLNGKKIEAILNKKWPTVQIEFIGLSNDTCYVLIPESNALTRQMGSAGARSFLYQASFLFTELNGINHVSFDFEEGDHAVPGVYDRNSFKNNI